MAVTSRRIFAAAISMILGTQLHVQAADVWRSAELGVRITAPNGWSTFSEGPRDAVMSPPVGDGRIALFSLPFPGADEEGTVDMEAVADTAIGSLRESFQKFKLLGRRPVEVGGLGALEIYFRGRVDGGKFRFVQTILVHRENQIILMYMAPDDNYTRFLGDYDQTVRSLRTLPGN